MDSHGASRFRSGLDGRHTVVIISLCTLVSLLISFQHLNHHHVNGSDIDVVGIAVKPTCVNQQAIKGLNRYLKPRTIHVITTSAAACTSFVRMAVNVVCHEEGALMKGVSHQTVANYIKQRLKADGESQFKGRNLAGWYLQQFLKLGAAQAIPSLSDYFVIWDLDMVLLNPLQVLRKKKGHTRTVVNVGGARHIPGYRQAFQKLTSRNLEFAPDSTSFVTHWMVVYKPYMAEFLTAITSTKKHSSAGSTAWVWSILDAVPVQHIDMGFSEYASYVSWVKQHYPESQHILKRRTWVRMPFGEGAVRLMQRLHSKNCCCPPRLLLLVLKMMHYQYTGYEVGHVASCGYNTPEHAQGYCVADL